MTAARQVGAFFDLDGTLLRGPSLESRFVAWLFLRGQTSNASLARWLAYFAKHVWRDPQAAIQGNKRYLAGLPIFLVSDWEKSLGPKSLAFFPQTLARISWHLGQEHRVFLVSGTLVPLARIAARRISPDIEVAATELEVADGCWTGVLADEHLSGVAKRRAIDALAAKHDLRLDQSYAYGDTMSDFAMLDCVAHSHAVHPTIWLRRIARKRKWPISRWESARFSRTSAALTVAKGSS